MLSKISDFYDRFCQFYLFLICTTSFLRCIRMGFWRRMISSPAFSASVQKCVWICVIGLSVNRPTVQRCCELSASTHWMPLFVWLHYWSNTPVTQPILSPKSTYSTRWVATIGFFMELVLSQNATISVFKVHASSILLVSFEWVAWLQSFICT